MDHVVKKFAFCFKNAGLEYWENGSGFPIGHIFEELCGKQSNIDIEGFLKSETDIYVVGYSMSDLILWVNENPLEKLVYYIWKPEHRSTINPEGLVVITDSFWVNEDLSQWAWLEDFDWLVV